MPRLDPDARPPRRNRAAPPPIPPARSPRNVSDRPTRWQLLLRRQRRLIKPALWALVGFGVVLAGSVIAHSNRPGGTVAELRSRLGAAVDMRIADIVIEGRNNTPESLLRAAIGASAGDPILGYSLTDARARIETLTWVEHATVQRRLPGTLVVSLTERRPFAVWQNQGKFQLIDRDGQVVADQDIAAFGQLPLVVGAGAPAHATAMLDLLAGYPLLRTRTIAIVRVGERRWNLRLNTGTDVLLPEGAEEAALARLMELQTGQSLLDRPLAVIDLRMAERLSVRPQPAGPPTPAGPPAPRRPT